MRNREQNSMRRIRIKKDKKNENGKRDLDSFYNFVYNIF